MAGMSRAEIAAKYGMSDGWAGGIIRDSGRTRSRSVAADAVPAVVSNGNRDVPPSARSKPATRPRVKAGKTRDPVRIVLAAIVAAVMAAVSYHHIVELALLAGAGWPAYVLPLALDGMVALAIRCLVVDGFRNPVAWLGLMLGFAGSAAANVYAYRPDLIDLDQAIIVIGLSPAVSFLIAGWLLERGTT